jgi:hypothetical protein
MLQDTLLPLLLVCWQAHGWAQGSFLLLLLQLLH